MKEPARIAFILKVILLLVVIYPVAHSEPPRNFKQQTNFDMESPLQNPVVLPLAALKALETSKLSASMLRGCAENDGLKVDQIPSSWFAGSWIELRRTRSSGLVLRAEHGCFWGAHITQFWLLSNAGGNYRVIFTGKADALRILSGRTNGYHDLQLIFAMQAGAEINYVTFKYRDGEYTKSGSRIEHPTAK